MIVEFVIVFGVTYYLTTALTQCLETYEDDGGMLILSRNMSSATLNKMAPYRNVIGDDVCSICLEQLQHNKVRVTSCGHSFCDTCIEGWLDIKPICPNCNKVLDI